MTRELCRNERPECVSWLARTWARQPARRAEIEATAARLPADADGVAGAALVAELARFVPGAIDLPARSAVDPAAAARATDRFARYSAAAIPFHRAALGATWDACRAATPTACVEGTIAAERRLGDLREPVAD